jgi:pimeloyl-ACP methyl ester carboxylesterase
MRRRAFLRMLFPPETLASICPNKLAAELAPMIGRDLADSPPIMMKQLKALAAHDCTSQLHKLSGIPTLVVSAEKDPIALTHFGQLLCLHIRGARYVEIGGASHGVTMQEAGKVNGLLREHFLASMPENLAKTLPAFDGIASNERLQPSGSARGEKGKASRPEKTQVAAAWSMSL